MNESDIFNKGYSLAVDHIKFRPKARLLSVLGEQLISNGAIAIKELVLNSYDADAEEVFINFHKDENGFIRAIELIDDGTGMTKDKIINGWFTPATSLKTKVKKNEGSKIYKRPILGEKGIGRFACRRLGETLDIRTRPDDYSQEFYFALNWSQYDVEEDDIYLDEVESVIYTKQITNRNIETKNIFDNYKKGTSIVISKLKEEWTETKINELKSELLKLIPPFINKNDFKIYIDGKEVINDIFLEKALFYIEGIVDSSGSLYYIMDKYPRNIDLKPGEFINGIDFSISIEDQIQTRCDFWKKEELVNKDDWYRYIDDIKKKGIDRNHSPQCGGFTFCAFAWDLDPIHRKRVGINDKKSREILRDLCGISIYRDGFRIWPYGSPGNDWLNLDKRAQGGQKPFHIANHQVIGYVGISENENPKLRDTSSREGIIEDNFYFSDLRELVLLSFSILEYMRYTNNRDERPVKDKEFWQQDNVKNEMAIFSKLLNEKSPELVKEFNKVIVAYEDRKEVTEAKITNLLEVSSSGVVFESVTHELISFLNKMDDQSKQIEKSLSFNPPQNEQALQSNILLKEALNIVLFEVKELQPFFKAARYKQKELDIKEIAIKSSLYFKYRLKNSNITFSINEISIMKKKAVEGFLLQIFSNLIDNSIYWLDNNRYVNKEILVTIDGNNNCFYFSDNGKGIGEEDKSYVFDPFFTRKEHGKGRGLGLYIVQELLSNYRGLIFVCNEFKPNYCDDAQVGTSFRIQF